MPIIVIGADTPEGDAILAAIAAPDREIRAFVSDPDIAAAMRSGGIKVALGDVSDDSHVEGASLGCFTAVMVEGAATDDRERSFASGREGVLDGWARAARASRVNRVIWVGGGPFPTIEGCEVAEVSPADPSYPATVATLDNAQKISSRSSG
jgi:hypothetical protein